MKLPDLDELIALRGAAQGLSLHTRLNALPSLQGAHTSPHKGRGLEFEEVRIYAPGDDVRAIDWRVTARRGKTHTKLFREERERPVWLVADLHPGLFFGSKNQFKSALLIRAAAILGWIAANEGDRFGAVISTGHTPPQLFPPRARQAGVLPVLRALDIAQPRAPGPSSGSGLHAALTALIPVLRHGSLILILSDFADYDDRIGSIIGGAALHNDFRLVSVSDPLECSGLPAGNYRVGIPGHSWWIDGSLSRAEWQSAWNQKENRLNDLSRRFNLPFIRLMTSQSAALAMPEQLKGTRWTA